jgi:hypothetical protein
MLLYHYDKESKVYLGMSEATKDPLESKLRGKDVFLIPAHSTEVPPPVPPEGFLAVWRDDRWSLETIPQVKKEIPLDESEQERWRSFRDSFVGTNEELRMALYGSLRYRLTDNDLQGDLDLRNPFPGSLTVDEMTLGYTNYIGDDDEKAGRFLRWKKEVKSYIRGLFLEGA